MAWQYDTVGAMIIIIYDIAPAGRAASSEYQRFVRETLPPTTGLRLCSTTGTVLIFVQTSYR
jgi:hypothetical protein